ncbi:TPA: hypothetical protein ACJJQH_001917, partial [Neisseria meningitidis]
RRNDGGRFGRCGGFGRSQPILQSTLTAFYESAAILGNAKKMPSENLSDGIFAGKSVKDFASA